MSHYYGKPRITFHLFISSSEDWVVTLWPHQLVYKGQFQLMRIALEWLVIHSTFLHSQVCWNYPNQVSGDYIILLSVGEKNVCYLNKTGYQEDWKSNTHELITGALWLTTNSRLVKEKSVLLKSVRKGRKINGTEQVRRRWQREIPGA